MKYYKTPPDNYNQPPMNVRRKKFYEANENRREIIFVEDINDWLADYYVDPKNPGAFMGRDKLFDAIKHKYAGISRTDISKFLRNNETSQLHSAQPRPKINRPFTPWKPGVRWAVDLVFIKNREQELIFTLLTCIDVFTKYAYAQIVPDKTAEACADAFRTILAHGQPKTLLTDNGLEFAGAFHKLLLEKGIKHLHTEAYNPTQNAIIERFNKTLKGLINKFLTAYNAAEIDDKTLQSLLANYNQTVHATTKVMPIAASEAVPIIRANIQARAIKLVEENKINYPAVVVGNMVRINIWTTSQWRRKTAFKKYAYQRQWTIELFKVAVVSRAHPGKSPQYTLFDMMDKDIVPRRFLRADLLLVDPKNLIKELEPGHYAVEEVLGRRGTKYFVKWVGYSSEFNSWVSASDSFKDKINEWTKK